MSNEEKLENYLKEIFNLVNSWLTFAEEKNGVLLSIYLGIIYTFIDKLEDSHKLFSTLVLFLIFIGTFVVISSFIPKFTIKSKNKIKNNHINNSVDIFYYDISSNYFTNGNPDVTKYLESLKNNYLFPNTSINFSKLHKDYATEIIINSKIIVSKYEIFKKGLIILIIILSLLGINKVWLIYNQDEYFVTCSNNIILREFPAPNANKKNILKKNEIVKKIEINDEWMKVEYKSEIGWIHKKLLIKK